MKKLLILLAFLASFSVSVSGQSSPPLTVTEVDGSPRGTNITTIKVSNGTLTISGRVATISTGGGGGSPGGSDTQLQYNNAGSFGGITGATTNGTVVTLTSPVLVTPAIGVATGTSLTVTGNMQVGIAALYKFGGSNSLSYTDSTGPKFTDGNTTRDLIFNVQSLSANRTVTWPDASGTVAFTSGVPAGANPTASVGLTAVNGSAPTFLRSDGAPPLDQGIAPTWTGAHAFSNTITQTSASATAFQSGPNGGTNPVFRIVNSTASQADGVSVTGLAAGSGTTFTAISSGSDSGLNFTGKGIGGFAFTSGVTTGTGTSSGLSGAFNSLTAGAGVNFASSSVTSGSVINVASTSTALASGNEALNIAVSGANGTNAITATGARISVTNTNATSGTNVALELTASGATTANYALQTTAGTVSFANSGSFTSSNPAVQFGGTQGFYYPGGVLTLAVGSGAIQSFTRNKSVVAADVLLGFTSGSGDSTATHDVILRRSAAANMAFGAADAASPVAQTLSVQNVVTGTSNTAGANWTHAASRGTGTGVGGDIIFQTAPAGSSGTSQNALAAAFTVKGEGTVELKTVTFANLPAVANARLIYCSDCTIASPCASGGSGALAKGINGAWVCN